MYQSHIFLEVRILLPSTEKAFCSCFISDTAGTCPICRREKGAFPKINLQAAKKACVLAHALDCSLNELAYYERPKGAPLLPAKHSLSGASVKIASNGFMDIEFHRRKKRISIQEVRLEEYAGRLTHANDEPHMDYNRAGAPNIRIRTGLDIELGEEAQLFLVELSRRIQYMGVLNGIPIETVTRCNAYISLAQYPQPPSYFVKLRNLNSFNFIRKAINSELHRQEDILISGGEVVSESRIWNEKQNRTEFYQSRDSVSLLETTRIEGAGSVSCPASLLAELRASAIEHPSERQNRFILTFGLSRARSQFLCDEKARADFFEQSIRIGADPMEAAHWIMADVTGLLRKAGKSIQDSPLSPRRFTAILEYFNNKTINSHIAKQLIQAVIDTDIDPSVLIAENNWSQITDTEQLRTIVKKVVEEHQAQTDRLRKGDMAPFEYLTGLVMKKTKKLADPLLVKDLLKEQLAIRIVYVLAMGGTISGNIEGDEISAGDEKILKTMLNTDMSNISVTFENITKDRILSEEIQPADWAAMIHAVCQKISTGTANGIVITHGTDTLAYTAALLFWLFADAPVPIVITASNTPPAAEGQLLHLDEARKNLNRAIQIANEKERGVYVVFGDRILSPLNLKYSRPSSNGFTNWNTGEAIFTGQGLLADYADTDIYVLNQILSEAADRMFLSRVFPGLRADKLLALAETGISHFFLELYEKGTGSMKETPYSLKNFLIKGRKKGCKVYCTSQQECTLDFSGYSTSRRLWREGAVPMGTLTTESAIALYFAASLVCDTVEEFDQIMENDFNYLQ